MKKIHHNIRVNVEYSPEIIHPTDEDGEKRQNLDFVNKRFYSQEDAKKVDLYFTVRGNPIPTVVVNRNLTTNPEYSNWTQIDLKNVQVHSKNNSHEFVVTIDAPTSEEGKLECEIIVENYLGRDSGITIVTPPDGDTSSKVWIMIVVGVVMSLIFIGILFFVVKNVAKNRGWFGYEARIEKYRVVPKIVKHTSDQEYSSVAGMEDSKF